MEGTVSDIRGYPLYCFIKEARSPAVAAPIKAAAAAGIHVKSISSRRSVLAIANKSGHCSHGNRAVKHNRESKHSTEACNKP